MLVVIESYWVYFVGIGIFVDGVAHKIHVGLDTSCFVVSSSLELGLHIVKECPHVHYIQCFVHRSSHMLIHKVLDLFIRGMKFLRL